ncbi:MAG: iron ABC transporter permease [Anaerolineales bacterium]|nr:iron ABC transporter permease [Anaerolineales bacterium]
MDGGGAALKRHLSLALLWAPALAYLALFYFYPLVSILALSLARSQGSPWGAFWQSLTSPTALRALGFTIWQALLSTLLTLCIGLPGAYLLGRYRFAGKSLLQALMGIPFVMPTLVVAAAFNALLGPSGWVNLLLMKVGNLDAPPIQFTQTLWAILVAHVFYNTTIILRIVGDAWSHLDPRMEQAAATLSASRMQRWRHITLPLLLPAVLSAALLVFIFDFTSFGVILVLGGPHFATLEVEIYYQTVSLFNLPMAATLSVVQLACTLILTATYSRLSTHLTRPQVLRPQSYTQRPLRTWQGKVLVTLAVLSMLAFFVTPLAALTLRSVTRLDSNMPAGSAGLTFDYYRELSINRRSSIFYAPPARAVQISAGYAAATVVLALALGLPVSWALASNAKHPFNQLMDPLLMLPLGTSAVTLGLGFIVALDEPPLDLRASWLLIPLAHTLVAFPFVVRSLTPPLRSIRPRLRHAAAVLGASPGEVFRNIDLPLIGRALAVAATFAFTISLGEFGATALIARPEYPTVPIAIYRYLSQPGELNYGQALALSTILMLLTSLGMLAIERLRVGEGEEF